MEGEKSGTPLKVTIKKWTAVAEWNWPVKDSDCGISEWLDPTKSNNTTCPMCRREWNMVALLNDLYDNLCRM